MEESNSLLDDFLAIAESISDNEEANEILKAKIKKPVSRDNEDEFFLEKISDFSLNKPTTSSNKGLSNKSEKPTKKRNVKNNLSAIHNGDTDSSDDEHNRDIQNSKFNDCGYNVKHLLGDRATNSSFGANTSTWKQKRVAPENASFKSKQSTLNFKKSEPVFTDPFFGIRISKPLIPSSVIQERMCDRAAVSMAKVKEFIRRENNIQDWVISGAIVSKSPVKTSQKGTKFIIWTLSDLKDDLKTVAMFLFGSAYKDLWKTPVGTVLGILNPSIMDQREGSRDQACLSVDNAQKVMIFGDAKDYGTCKSKKKDGEKCNAFVNTNQSEYCTYHIRQEYQKLSKRSELQANFAGRGLTALRNKVLGKNEVFYAGKSYMAIPAKKNTKQMQRDNNLMKSLSEVNKTGILTSIGVDNGKKKMAQSLDVSRAQRIRDLQLLQKLNGEKLTKKSPTPMQRIDKALNIDKALLHAEDILKDMEKLETVQQIRLVDNSIENASGNGSRFNLLNTEPSVSLLNKNGGIKTKTAALNRKKLNGSKLTDINNGQIDLLSPISKLKTKNIHTPKSSELVSTQLSPKPKFYLEENSSENDLGLNYLNTEPSTSGLNQNDTVKTKSVALNCKKFSAPQLSDLNNGQKDQSSPIRKLNTQNIHTPKSSEPVSTNLSDLNNDHVDLSSPMTKPKTQNINTPKSSEHVSTPFSPKPKFNIEEHSSLSSKSKFFQNLDSPKISGNSPIDSSTPVPKTTTMETIETVQQIRLLDNGVERGNKKKLVDNGDSENGVGFDLLNMEPSASRLNKIDGVKTKTTALNVKKLSAPKLSDLNNGQIDLSSPIRKSKTQNIHTPKSSEPVSTPVSPKPKFNIEEYSSLLAKSKFFKNLGSPKISGNSRIDLSTPVPKTSTIRIDKAKLKAIKYIQKHGQIKKGEEEPPKKNGVKRFLEDTGEDFREKRSKIAADSSFTSQRFKQIMALQSKHTTLLEEVDREKEEKYFKKMEIKEKMEEKMMTIFKADCKAVRCLTCKYTSFSASDKCKEQRHVLKVFNSVKRFFKCGKCGYRTVSLDIIPLVSCSNCGSSKWERTTMMQEKIVQVGETLSIRGLEEKYIGAVNTGGNINLLVPDE